jgi:alkyl hydroperoxide reductase subunit AhpC
VIGLSVDPVEKHVKWASHIEDTQGHAPNSPMIGDTDRNVSKHCGVLPVSIEGSSEGRAAADNQTVRSLFVMVRTEDHADDRLSDDHRPECDERLRRIDSLQLTASHKVATPVNWEPGEDAIIAGSISDDEAKKVYPNGWRAPRPSIRFVPQPGS